MLGIVLVVKLNFGLDTESSMLMSCYWGITDLQGNYSTPVHRAVFKCQFRSAIGHNVRLDPKMQG